MGIKTTINTGILQPIFMEQDEESFMQLQRKCKYNIKLQYDIYQPFFLSLFQDFSVTRRLREDHKGKENTLEDTARDSMQGIKVRQIEKWMYFSVPNHKQDLLAIFSSQFNRTRRLSINRIDCYVLQEIFRQLCFAKFHPGKILTLDLIVSLTRTPLLNSGAVALHFQPLKIC